MFVMQFLVAVDLITRVKIREQMNVMHDREVWEKVDLTFLAFSLSYGIRQKIARCNFVTVLSAICGIGNDSISSCR